MSKLKRYLEAVGLPGSEVSLRRDGWDVQIAQRDGKDVAIVVSRGTEIHFVSLHEKHAMTRKNTLAFLEPIYREWGFVTTRVPQLETNHRLREILGFQLQWRDENFSYWSMTKLPFSKVKP